MTGSSNFIYLFVQLLLIQSFVHSFVYLNACNAVLKLYLGYLGYFFLMPCTTSLLTRLIRIYAPRPLELPLESR